MKRQRIIGDGIGSSSSSSNKMKCSKVEGNRGVKRDAEAEKETEEVVGKKGEEERRKDIGDVGFVVGLEEDGYWPWLGSVADEQMSWGSIWLPLWDMDFMGEAYNALFSDVAWDDDIWNLKSINNTPNP